MRTSCAIKRGRRQHKRMREKGNTETEPERGKHTATHRARNERAREQKERKGATAMEQVRRRAKEEEKAEKEDAQ